MSLLSRLGLTFLSGAALSFIQAPYNLWFLIFPCFSLFYFLWQKSETKKQAFFSGFLFAFGYSIVGLYWIGNALLVEGNPYKWVWPLAVIALPAALALFTALYSTIAHILFKNKKGLTTFIGFCSLLALSEWVRGYAFTGFPWNLYGYGWASILPISQTVSVVGPYGLTFLTILWGACAALLFTPTRKNIGCVIISFGILIGAYLWGVERLAIPDLTTHDDVALHIVQPNIEQKNKWDSFQLRNNFEKHLVLSSRPKTAEKNIIIWPETALPPAFLNSQAVNERIQSILGSQSILLAGGLKIQRNTPSEVPRYHNALMLWDQDNEAAKLYSKSHLVPFGEYIPFQKYIPLKPIVEFSGFERGTGPQVIRGNNLPSFSPLICYEIIFPHQAIPNNQDRPDYILTITNDAWYGDSPGPYQHFTQALFRAIENGVPVVRSANTGISGLIDPMGRIVSQSALMEDNVLEVALPLKTPQRTYYSVFRDKLFLGFIFIAFGLSLIFSRKKDVITAT